MSLTDVKGIGNGIAKQITELTGIETLEQFAAMDSDTIEKVADNVPGDLDKVLSWVEQAKELSGFEPEVEVVESESQTVDDEDQEEDSKNNENDSQDSTVDDVSNSNNASDSTETLSIDEWIETEGNKLIELGHARSTILARAARAFGQERRPVMKQLNMSISTIDNLRKIFS